MRLIDADELIDDYLNHCRTEFEIKNCCMVNENVIAIIQNAPTVDTYTEDDVQEAIKAGYQVGYELPKAKFEKPQEWIPVKYRPLTGEERTAFAEHYGIEYCDTEDEKAFDCLMPEDGQEILVSRSWGVSTDVADNDIDGEGFIVYGLEGNGDWEGIDAWMPLPEPYKEAEE